MRRTPDWCGALKRKFRWNKLRREWGRMCFVTDFAGDTIESWWEWEVP